MSSQLSLPSAICSLRSALESAIRDRPSAIAVRGASELPLEKGVRPLCDTRKHRVRPVFLDAPRTVTARYDLGPELELRVRVPAARHRRPRRYRAYAGAAAAVSRRRPDQPLWLRKPVAGSLAAPISAAPDLDAPDLKVGPTYFPLAILPLAGPVVGPSFSSGAPSAGFPSGTTAMGSRIRGSIR